MAISPPKSKPARSAAAEFSALWADAGKPPDVFSFLQERPDVTLREKADVLLIDQRYHWYNGSQRPVEEYLARCPDIAAADSLKIELITEEIGYREQIGDSPELEEFLERFPELDESGFDDITRRIRDGEIPSPTELISLLLDDVQLCETLHDSSLQTASRAIGAGAGQPSIAAPDASLPFLCHCQPFNKLPVDVVRRIEAEMHVEHFSTGDVLLRQGEPGTSLLVVVQGVVEIVIDDAAGERHSIGRGGRGDVLGEMALLSDEPRSADVVARSDIELLVLPAETFRQLADKYVDLCVVLTELVATRLGGRTRDVLADKTFAGYRIKRRLGRGGMAIVYEAVQLASERRVALKMMSHRLVHDATAQRRFQREAELISSFDHLNICRMYDRFDAFFTCFIVMEYLDGLTVEALLKRRGPLPVGEVKKILGQVAAALDYAHRDGIAHRDIKPSNIMILRDGTVKLMDFGLAAPFAEKTTDGQGFLIGTPRYMAPEQLFGQPAGREADYFALAAVAYEMLTSRPLFPSADIGRLVDAHIAWNPASFAEICPGADDELRDALRDAVAPAPDRRKLDLARLCGWSASVDFPVV